jgi:hypothetical protein
MTTITCGDILLYYGLSLSDYLIQSATHGPYSHVAIAISDTDCIEAISHGVCLNSIRQPNKIIRIGNMLEPSRRDYAVQWLMRQVEKECSYVAIVADFIKAVLPKQLSGTPFLVAPSHFDCSQLATQFLIVAGYMPLPDEWYSETSRLSPNDIDRATIKILPA